MVVTILGIVLTVVGFVAIMVRGVQLVGVAALAVSALVFIGASMHTVPTRNVGIVTQFNKPTGETTGAGLVWTAPWQQVDDWDASSNTYNRLGKDCLWVSIAAQRRACIPVQIEWNAKPEGASRNWGNYKEIGDWSRFETFVNRRVDRQIDGAITSVFASFDPLGGVTPAAGADAASPDLNKTYKDPLRTAILAALGEDIEIRSIAFTTPGFDDATNAAIAAYGQKMLEARNLKVDEANAETRKRITEKNAQVPNVTRCLEIAQALNKEPGLCMTPATATRPIG